LSDNYSFYQIQDTNISYINDLKAAVIEANPKCNSKVLRQANRCFLRTTQDSIDYLKRMELHVRKRVNWQQVGEKDVFDYNVLSKNKNGGWKDTKGVMSIVGREIAYIDSLDSSQSIKLLMGEVKIDTIDFGQGKLMRTDICIAKRTDVVNDNTNYRFTLNHILDTNFYSATLSEWNNMQNIFNVKLQPIKQGD
jgi:hypothetical protein